MGAETATDLAAPRGPFCDVDGNRARCWSRVSEVVSLYEELENALVRMDRETLTRLAAKTAPDERPLAFWARRVRQRRDRDARRVCGPGRNALETIALRRRRAVSFVWEAVAFALGFGMSLFLIVKGA